MKSSAVSLVTVVAFGVMFQSFIMVSHSYSSLMLMDIHKNASNKDDTVQCPYVMIASSCCASKACCPNNGLGVYANCFNANNMFNNITGGLVPVNANNLCGGSSGSVCSTSQTCITLVSLDGSGSTTQQCCNIVNNTDTNSNTVMCNNNIQCYMGNGNSDSGTSSDGKYACCNAGSCNTSS